MEELKEGWKRVELGEVAEYINKKINTLNLSEKNYISTENMNPNRGGINTSANIPKETKVNHFEKNDVLFSNIRTYFKKLWRAEFSGGASNDVLIIRSLNSDKMSNEYLYYVLSEERFFDYTVNTSKGTKMPRGDKSAIMQYDFDLPSLETQEKIASILSALDDKIEINNEMNKTLEEMAQTLFKRWFIDFDFPNENGEPYKTSGGKMIDSELGEIPEGWEVKEIQNIIEVKDGTHDSPKQNEKGYRLVTSKHLEKNRINFESANIISEIDYIKINKRSQVNQYDILISMIGTIGNLYLVMEKKINYVIKNIGLFKTSQNKKYYSYTYFYLKTELIENYIKSRLAGSTQQYISLGELRKIPIIVPSNQALDNYIKISEKKLEKIYFNIQEIQSLTEIRDTLLPKLMSGEVEV
ncbi:MAG: restriction endonuclease subunit S [Cetobacterium sp.]